MQWQALERTESIFKVILPAFNVAVFAKCQCSPPSVCARTCAIT